MNDEETPSRGQNRIKSIEDRIKKAASNSPRRAGEAALAQAEQELKQARLLVESLELVTAHLRERLEEERRRPQVPEGM